MTPEQRTAERFARENQMRSRKEAMFSLEEGDEDEMQLTHMGESIPLDSEFHNDFENNLHGTDANLEPLRKRKRLESAEYDAGESVGLGSNEEETQRKKSKSEVMREIITKSKFHKYERQKAKEDDNELRESLDKGLPNVFEMMRGSGVQQYPAGIRGADLGSKSDSFTLSHGKGDATEQQYDRRLRQLVYDTRSKASDRTKTEEEMAVEEAGRLKELEQERIRRMHEDTNNASDGYDTDEASGTEYENDDAKRFGLHQTSEDSSLAVEDEDNFVIDENLVESGSFIGSPLSGSDVGDTSSEREEDSDDGDDFEYLKDLMPKSTRPMELSNISSEKDSLAFTYPCPETHEEFLRVLDGLSIDEIPTVVQRIRALYHPRLDEGNKAKLGVFSGILVHHIGYMANNDEQPPFYVSESLIRHIHSLSKSYPQEVSSSFRSALRDIADKRPLKLLPGDLILLTGIATIFPTSDHFHAVATPSILSMCRYLGHGSFASVEEIVTGAYVANLCLQYQALSKRYVPEFINFIMRSLSLLIPGSKGGDSHLTRSSSEKFTRLHTDVDSSKHLGKIRIWDVLSTGSLQENCYVQKVKASLLATVISLLDVSMGLWVDEHAFNEIFAPVHHIMRLHLTSSFGGIYLPESLLNTIRLVTEKLDNMFLRAERGRMPLLLQNHKPLPIKMAIPKFEEAFNPDRHYDPNHERAQLSKLKAEHKRERKGAMRELRRDANFVARTNLHEKKARDAEYEKKYSRLVAEIQGEEGHNAKQYAEEKRKRTMKR